MPYLQRIQSQSLIMQTLCDNLQLAPQLGALLLNVVLSSRVSPGSPKRAMDDFLALVGDGLSASYYPTIDLSGSSVLSRVDATVDFNWGFGLPDPTITARPFSVEWTGYVMPQYTEIYTFYVLAGDGVRLWVNGQPMWPPNDEWKDQLPNEHASLPITLATGQLYQIKLDYYDHTASGVIQLSWSSSSTPKAVIPQSQLFSGAVMQSLAPIVNTYNLLYKTTLLANTFPLTAADVSYLYQHGLDFAGVDPADPLNSAKFVSFDPNLLPLPALLSIDLPASMTYNTATQTLSIVGAMTLAEKTQLLGFSPDLGYQAAINNLYTTSQAGGTTDVHAGSDNSSRHYVPVGVQTGLVRPVAATQRGRRLAQQPAGWR